MKKILLILILIGLNFSLLKAAEASEVWLETIKQRSENGQQVRQCIDADDLAGLRAVLELITVPLTIVYSTENAPHPGWHAYMPIIDYIIWKQGTNRLAMLDLLLRNKRICGLIDRRFNTHFWKHNADETTTHKYSNALQIAEFCNDGEAIALLQRKESW